MINTWEGTGEQEFYLVPSSSYQRDSQAAVKILQKNITWFRYMLTLG
jgi:hypothetical protein